MEGPCEVKLGDSQLPANDPPKWPHYMLKTSKSINGLRVGLFEIAKLATKKTPRLWSCVLTVWSDCSWSKTNQLASFWSMLKQRFDGSNTVLLLCFLVVVSVAFVVVVVTFFVVVVAVVAARLLVTTTSSWLSVIFICFADGCASKLCDKGKYFLRYSPAETTLMS